MKKKEKRKEKENDEHWKWYNAPSSSQCSLYCCSLERAVMELHNTRLLNSTKSNETYKVLNASTLILITLFSMISMNLLNVWNKRKLLIISTITKLLHTITNALTSKRRSYKNSRVFEFPEEATYVNRWNIKVVLTYWLRYLNYFPSSNKI